MLPTLRPLLPLVALAMALPVAVLPIAAEAHAACRAGLGHHGMPARLTVTGEGRARVAPDMAVVSLGVTSQAVSAAEAMAANSAQQAKVIEALKAQGIAAEDIQTSGLNLSPLMNYEDGKAPVVTGYQAQNMVTLRVKALDRLGAVLDAIVAAGANEIQGISFAREDDMATGDEARRGAIAEARRRAGVLAEAAGLTLGPVIAIRDTMGAVEPMPMAMMARDMKAGSAVPIEAGQLGMTAAVQMDFALLPAAGEGGTGGCRGEGPMMHGEGMMPHGQMHGQMMESMGGHDMTGMGGGMHPMPGMGGGMQGMGGMGGMHQMPGMAGMSGMQGMAGMPPISPQPEVTPPATMPPSN